MESILPIFVACIMPLLWTALVFVAGYIAGRRNLKPRAPWYAAQHAAGAGNSPYSNYYQEEV